MQWSQDPKVLVRFQQLSELPLLTLSSSLAKIVQTDLLYSAGDDRPRFLGEFNRRNWLGTIDMSIKIYLSPTWHEPSEKAQMTLGEFIGKYPIQAEFVKKRLAAVVLHNAFESGRQTIISEDVRVFYSSHERSFDLHILPMGARDAHPMDDTKRFIESVAKLPIQKLVDIPVTDIESFLKQPENLRWVLQIYQLNKIVGEEIVRSELARHLIRHPHLIIHFLRKKWLDQKINAFFNSHGNRCWIFYKGH